MSKLLLAPHALLLITPFLPVVEYHGDLQRPRENKSAFGEAREVLGARGHSKSIVAAGLPAFLALLNVPFLSARRPRWSALSSAMIGLGAAGLMAQLLAHYSQARLWGAWVIWGLSLALLVAGTAAYARLGGRPCERCGHAS